MSNRIAPTNAEFCSPGLIYKKTPLKKVPFITSVVGTAMKGAELEVWNVLTTAA